MMVKQSQITGDNFNSVLIWIEILIISSALIPGVSAVYSSIYNGPMFSTGGDALLDWSLDSPVPSGQALLEWQIRTDTPEVKAGESLEVTLDMHLRYQYEKTEERLHQTSPEILTASLDTTSLNGGLLTFPAISTGDLEGLGDDRILPLQGDTTISRTINVPVSDSLTPGTYTITAELKGTASNPLSITVASDQNPTPTKTATPTPTPTVTKPVTPTTSKAPATGNPTLTLTMSGPYASESNPTFTIQKGQPLTQTYGVTNTGSVESGPLTLEFTLKSGATVTLGTLPISSLSPGQSTSGSVTHPIPMTAQNGDYTPYLTAKTGTTTIAQIYYPRSVVIYDTPGLKPDLMPMVMQIPQTLISGSTISVPCSVKNKGGANAGPTDVMIYLSPEKQFSNSAILIGTGQLGALNAGATGQISISGNIPQSTMNAYYYPAIVVDASKTIPESDETNNIAVYDQLLTITGASGPDLMGTILSTSVKPDGKTLLLSYRIMNTGKVAATGAKLTLSLTDQYWNGGAQLAVIDLPSITVGQVYAPAQVQYTPVVDFGDYYVRGTITLPSDVNQENNVFSSPQTVHLKGSGPLPDLSIAMINVPPTAKAGETITVSDILYNTGSADAGPVTVKIYLSSDQTTTSADTNIGSHVVASAVQNGFPVGSASVNIPASTLPGTYFIGAIVDPDNAIPEKNENNNDGYPLPITITAAAGLPVAAFTLNPQSGQAPLIVTCTDTSTGGPTGWAWNFGDGGSSTEQNPSYTYTNGGTYTITLTTTKNSATSSATKTITVTSASLLTAAFDLFPSSGQAPLTVLFTDKSTGGPTGWAWNFGDGGSSTEQNPSHTYTNGGTYTITLTATKNSATSSATKTITVTSASLLTAAFDLFPSSGPAPLAVQFNDRSTGGPTSELWDFGDGVSSTEQNPSHIYTKAGTYTITQTVKKGSESNSATKTVTVTAASVTLVALIQADPTDGPAPLTVQFSDVSKGNPTTRTWDQGDGESQNSASFSYTYEKPGTYRVILTIGNDAGQTSTTTTSITVTDSIVAVKAGFEPSRTSGEAPLTVTFADSSSGNPSSYLWDFGDSETSTGKSPEHTYTKEGTYQVTLTVTSDTGTTDSVTKTITVTGGAGTLKAAFSYAPKDSGDPLVIIFTDQTAGDVQSYRWDFGDGGDSDERNPEQAYTKTGTYTVTLTVTNTAGSDSVTKSVTIGSGTDSSSKPEALASVSQKDPNDPFTFQFGDNSWNPDGTRTWDFGDGTSNNDAYTSHRYTKPGTYKVILTVKNAAGSDTDQKWARVEDTSLPVVPTADFTYSPSSGSTPLTVQFTDTSTGNPTSWSWEFGDGTTSSDQNPRHVFTGENSGFSIPVKLTVSNQQGSDFKIVENAIEIKISKDVDYSVSIDAPGEITPGTEFFVPTTVSTSGTGNAQQVDVRYYLSTDAVYLIESDTSLTQMHGFGADPGTSITLSASPIIPQSVGSGTYYLIAYVNQGKEAFETDYLNNIGMKQITVTGGVKPTQKPAAVPPEVTPAPVISVTPAPKPASHPSSCEGISIPLEPGIDRLGGDYTSLDLDSPDPCSCARLCQNDDACRAFTYVDPGVQGEKARCWLKNVVPDQRTMEVCVSGVKPSTTPPEEKGNIGQTERKFRIEQQETISGGTSTHSIPIRTNPDGSASGQVSWRFSESNTVTAGGEAPITGSFDTNTGHLVLDGDAQNYAISAEGRQDAVNNPHVHIEGTVVGTMLTGYYAASMDGSEYMKWDFSVPQI